MAEWRIRGYVADSDEEDDSQASEPQNAIYPVAWPALIDREDDPTEQQKRSDPLSGIATAKGEDGRIPHLSSTPSAEESLRTEDGKQGFPEGRSENQPKPAECTGTGEIFKNAWRGIDDRDEVDELQRDTTPPSSTKRGSDHGSVHKTEDRSTATEGLSTSEGTLNLPAFGGVQLSPPVAVARNIQERLPLTLSQEPHEETAPRPGNPNPNRLVNVVIEVPSSTPSQRVGTSRNLRHRNPIQLHPYAIESEKYRQDLKARGLKPLRIAQTQNESQTYHGDESQMQDIAAEGMERSSTPGSSPSSPISEPPNIPESSVPRSGNVESEGEEFPDVDTLLRAHPEGVFHNGFKRRKTAHTFSRKNHRVFAGRVSDPSKGKISLRHGEEEATLFDVPASPPLSSGSHESEIHARFPRFKVPRRISPVALPTPLTSSEPRRPPNIDIPEVEQSPMSDELLDGHEASEVSSSSEGSSSESQPANEMRSVQRKIRGVLPASWLKLDLKTQTKRSKRNSGHEKLPAVGTDNLQRGIARRRSVGQSVSPSANGVVRVVSSDDDESDPQSDDLDTMGDAIRSSKTPTLKTSRQWLEDERFSVTLGGEVEEDNRIDQMLPAPRKTSATARKRKSGPRARTIKHTLGLRGSSGISKVPHRNTGQQPKITSHITKKRGRQSAQQPPRLGILDTSTLAGNTETATPSFVRVARRTARARNDKGRQSPSRKQLRLATIEDTQEVEQILKDWRKGKIKPRYKARSGTARPPLIDLAGNNEILPRQAKDPTLGTKAKIPRSHTQKTSLRKPRRLQGTLNSLFARSTMPEAREPKVRKFKYTTCEESSRNPSRFGHIIPSIEHSSDTRPALLEGPKDDYPSVFQQGLSHITKIHQTGSQTRSKPPKKRVPRQFLSSVNNNTVGHETFQDEEYSKFQTSPVRRQVKKSMSHGLAGIQQPLIRDLQAVDLVEVEDSLAGLDHIDKDFTVFDIQPLPVGVKFGTATFIGSGEFHKYTKVENFQAMDQLRGFQSFSIQQETFALGPWNELAASQLEKCFEIIQKGVLDLATSSNVSLNALNAAVLVAKSIIHYISSHLSFADPTDRAVFLRFSKSSLDKVVQDLPLARHADTHSTSVRGKREDLHIMLGMFVTVMIHQIHQVANHAHVPSPLKDEIGHLLASSARMNLRMIIKDQFKTFLSYLDHLSFNGYRETRDLTFQEHYEPIQALVANHHILVKTHGSLELFWTLVNDVVSDKCENLQPDITILEQRWKCTLSLLPFLELDVQGKLEPGRRFKTPFENWKAVKPMIETVFSTYNASSTSYHPKFNAYCRQLYARCFRLIKYWQWGNCNSILGILFDNFAQNDLAHLRNEEYRGNHGSPAFLDHLDEAPSLKLRRDDRCFHILLKIIGEVLRHLRQRDDSRNIQNLIFRLMPNHGRYLRKEEEVAPADLAALRNHHDLLCTLYWSSPPKYRPHLRSFQDLVDIDSSHTEACQLSVRAWSRLVNFQLSTDESLDNIDPFADWHSNILQCTLGQLDVARTEGESAARKAGLAGLDDFDRLEVSENLLELKRRIFKMFTKLEAVVVAALAALETAVTKAPSNEAASKLIKEPLALALQRLDLSLRQRNNIVLKALDVVLAYTRRSKADSKDKFSQRSTDDSQEYGDWSAFDDVDTLGESTLKMLETPLRVLLSNSFGADTVMKDELLSKIVDCYTSLASVLVHQGLRSWENYLHPFGQCSWELLRSTPQSQKYHSYYLANLLELSRGVYATYKEYILKTWLVTIVEREASLKFQHVLTSSILNVGQKDDLLYNPPFSVERASGRFNITANEFSAGRNSLIFMILSNMWEAVKEMSLESHGNVVTPKQQYKELLGVMMGAMKRNYQELGQSDHTGGTYIEFVQSIVQALHKNTSTICPVDKFFTDPSKFPLPETDPAYIVGQLQNYGLRLEDPRTHKQLAAFLQSLSEKAAKGNQQADLASNLFTAMSDNFEIGDTAHPSLRTFLIKAIFPAYLVIGFKNHSGLVFLLPFLKALQMVFRTLSRDFAGHVKGCVTSVTSMISSFLHELWSSWPTSTENADCLEDRHMLRLLGECYVTVTALLPVIDHIHRTGEPTDEVAEVLIRLKSFADWSLKSGQRSCLDLWHETAPKLTVDPAYQTVRVFTQKELERSLQSCWFKETPSERARISYNQGGTEVVKFDLKLASYPEELDSYREAVQEFLDGLEAYPFYYGNDDREDEGFAKAGKGFNFDDVMI